MRREDAAIGMLWLIVLVIAGVAVLNGVTQALGQIAAAVIGGAAVLLGAILTHVFTSLREQRLELQRQKQHNYLELLNRLAKFVRKQSDENDDFTTIHLHSWVVGCPEVIILTQRFMEKRSDTHLRQLLVAMRQDVGVGLSEPGQEASVSILFGPLPTPEHLTLDAVVQSSSASPNLGGAKPLTVDADTPPNAPMRKKWWRRW